MTGADLFPTISSSLIRAAELSYVEDAPGTRSVLEKLNTLLRYADRKPPEVRITEEWAILLTFLELQRIQYPDRFSYKTSDIGELPWGFIPRGKLLLLLHNEFVRCIESWDDPLAFDLQITSKSPFSVEMTIGSKSGRRTLKW